jgi:hypothetical protein
MYAQKFTNFFDVIREMQCRIAFKTGVRGGLSCATLVKQYDAKDVGIKKSAVIFLAPGAGSAVQEKHGQTFFISAFLDVKFVQGINLYPVCGIRLDARK